MTSYERKKMKILCLHGFRTSGSFLKKQINKWDPSIFQNFDLDFPDGLFPAGGKSDIEGFFPPPYYEWFQFNKEFTEYTNLEECISYYVNISPPKDLLMVSLAFLRYSSSSYPLYSAYRDSQGATLSALLLGYQSQGKVLTDHPPLKFLISISGSKFRIPSICDVAYKELINAKSVHFIGEKDWLKLPSEDLAKAFQDPLIIRHSQGHTVPRLDEAAIEQLVNWTRELSVLTNDIKDDRKNGEAQREQGKSDDTATEEHTLMKNAEAEGLPA